MKRKKSVPKLAEIERVIALFNAGNYSELESKAHVLVKQNPAFGFYWKALGTALHAQGKNALLAMQKAAELLPDDAEAHRNLGNALNDLGRLEEAAESYRRALEIKPNFAEAHFNLGNTLQELGQFKDAAASYRRALEVKHNFAEAHLNLGNTLNELGQFNEAAESYRRALEINPCFAEAHCNLGNALHGLGKLNDAVSSFRRALEINPGFAEAHSNLGNALQDLGQLDDAIASHHRALEIRHNFAKAHFNLGNALKEQGRLGDAEVCYRRSLEIEPVFAEAHYNLGNVLQNLGRLDDAVTSYRQALEISPDYAEAYCNLGGAYRDLGRLDEAVASYRRALQFKPNFFDAYSNLLFISSYHALNDSHEYLSLARGWEQACVPAQDREASHRRVFHRTPLSCRRLKVGYVSGDYRQHAVSYFIEQLFTNHDRSRIELFAYSTHARQDAVTERLQTFVEHWVQLAGLSDDAIREQIDTDCIDVLIDLSGHTQNNRLGIFARRAAPVQAHYLGYFASTGLTEMDYWIGDDILTPASTDDHFSEQVWRLPRVWVSYAGNPEAPVTDWCPDQDGVVWLGSFNNLGKLTPATLVLWAKVLHALPEGKLLLKTKELGDQGNRQRILEAMAGHGIPSERIELQDGRATLDWPAHMAYYDRLDIALDPVGGMGGSTTTCDALWMGVPVISLEGDRVASRMTASMLSALGHPEWIARSEAEYIDKVVALARDVEGRKALRSTQRNRMTASPLCDGSGLATALENAYFEMAATRSQRKGGESTIRPPRDGSQGS